MVYQYIINNYNMSVFKKKCGKGDYRTKWVFCGIKNI